MKRRLLIIAMATTVVAGILAAVAVARTHGVAKVHDTTAAVARHAERALHASHAPASRHVRARIALLRGASVASAEDLGVPFLQDAHRAFADSRLQVLGASLGGAFGETCVYAVLASKPDGASGACAANADFNARGVSVLLGTGPDVDVVGLVPNGVTSVTLTSEDGSSQKVAVTNNGYTAHSSASPSRLSFRGATGLAEQDLSR